MDIFPSETEEALVVDVAAVGVDDDVAVAVAADVSISPGSTMAQVCEVMSNDEARIVKEILLETNFDERDTADFQNV